VWLCLRCHNRTHQRQHFLRHSELTRVALAAKKAQGVRLGNPTNLAEASAKGAAANRKLADDFARNVLPIVEKLRDAGTTSLLGIARALNERGVRTPQGAAWHASSVRNLLQRAVGPRHCACCGSADGVEAHHPR
jgi:hypothetical protein